MESEKAFEYFKEISKIPRMPDYMGKISKYIYEFGRSLGLETYVDAAENVVIKKPGTAGKMQASPIMLQAHMDMVCEKSDDLEHNFLEDPIQLIITDQIVTADRTTLGADDGVGVAYIMGILASDDITHPPVEALFTTNEETDMRGAEYFSMEKCKAELIINLDAEAVTISGCGEMETKIVLSKEKIKNMNHASAYKIAVGGMVGGHSGLDATKERGNPIVLLARILNALFTQKNAFRFIGIKGGAGMSSAIPRQAECEILCDADEEKILKIIRQEQENIVSEYGNKNPLMFVRVEKTDNIPVEVFSDSTTQKLINLLMVLPDGVSSRVDEDPDYMGNCYNIGSIGEGENEIVILGLIRGYTQYKKEILKNKIKILCNLIGCQMIITRDVPNWECRKNQHIRECVEQVYGKKTKRMDATTECGYFLRQKESCVALGLGIPVYNMHSPDEYFEQKDFEEYWIKLKELLGKL